jgi:hypothetical protein
MPKSSQKIGEANFKTAVFQEYFGTKKFAYMQELDRIDFIITDNTDRHLIWAETKKDTAGIVEMFVQLTLTIGKARTFDRYFPPPFLCAFDYEKIAFLHYSAVQDIFYQNDFNWNIKPSDHKSKEFKQIKDIVEKTVQENNMMFSFDNDKLILKQFINNNFSSSSDLLFEFSAHLQIDKNNFIPTYNRWVEMVKPSIAIDWDMAKKKGIIDGDFYLADLLSENNITIKDKLFVLLDKTKYELDRQLDDMGLFTSKTVQFKDNGFSHRHFWEIYKRPPQEEYWDYMVERRDLLVPQDVRERKGAFYTPPQWVKKAHEYLAKTFGEYWQDEYYVWDNSAGTGNLLAGLKNKDKIWASTLDQQDVDAMYDRIGSGLNLWKEQVFQFDFLNDDFEPKSKGGKLPDKLFEIINSPEERKKIIFLINPPYGEAANARTRTSKGTVNEMENKAGVKESIINERFKNILGGMALNEKYIQFFARIYTDIPSCKMAAFVKPKYVSGPNMKRFRDFWKADYLGGFATPATTHDNCTGEYPICLFIWDLSTKNNFPEKVPCDIFNKKEKYEGVKNFYCYDGKKYIIEWLRKYYDKEGEKIAYLRMLGTDMQNSSGVYIIGQLSENDIREQKYTVITKNNIIEISIYFVVRKVIPADWLNDRDQFLYPNDKWETDEEFQSNCLAYTLFNSYNKVKIREGTNHWIPFTEDEVGCEKRFESRFMSDFLKGKTLSKEVQAVFDAGKKLWCYYHQKAKTDKNADINASFYDIREYFQGRSEKGTMKTKSNDETYNALIKDLRQKLSLLADKIKPKVYEYGFLLE